MVQLLLAASVQIAFRHLRKIYQTISINVLQQNAKISCTLKLRESESYYNPLSCPS